MRVRLPLTFYRPPRLTPQPSYPRAPAERSFFDRPITGGVRLRRTGWRQHELRRRGDRTVRIAAALPRWRSDALLPAGAPNRDVRIRGAAAHPNCAIAAGRAITRDVQIQNCGDGANWSRVWENKNVRIVAIEHN